MRLGLAIAMVVLASQSALAQSADRFDWECKGTSTSSRESGKPKPWAARYSVDLSTKLFCLVREGKCEDPQAIKSVEPDRLVLSEYSGSYRSGMEVSRATGQFTSFIDAGGMDEISAICTKTSFTRQPSNLF